jgi:hypothetical protein
MFAVMLAVAKSQKCVDDDLGSNTLVEDLNTLLETVADELQLQLYV